MQNPINSPFRYAGGKFYARKLILEHIPKHNIYIEPFVGGGSIFFAKNKVKHNQLNDIDCELINVYKIIKDEPIELINFLKKRKKLDCNIPSCLLKGVKIGDPLPQKF
jgi:DNA adenine methylase